ncbi:MAG: thioesterase family protein [Actinomycetota bacterium]
MDAKSFLGMQQVAENQWTLTVTERLITPGNFLFGGCGLAAGLVALEGASGRPTVWSAAHYLSHAPTGSLVTVTTELPAVGGRVTQGRAVARVGEREVLSVIGSFGHGELSSPSPWDLMPEVPAPDDCPPRLNFSFLGESVFSHIDTRIALGRSFQQLDGIPGQSRTALWARLTDHPDFSAATLAIFGDYVSGGSSDPMGIPLMGRSLDNTIRIANLEPTEWVLCDIRMHALHNGFAQGTAFLWSETGVLLATASQSISVKKWTPDHLKKP